MNGLAQVRRELWDSVKGLSDEVCNQTIEEGKWTIAQVMEHLFLVERAVASQLKHGIHEESEYSFESKSLGNILDRTLKMRVSNPALEPKSEFQTIESLKIKLYKSRQQLEEAVNSLTEEQLNHRGMHLPIFGMLSLRQWVDYVALHESRHIEQIHEIRRALARKKNNVS